MKYYRTNYFTSVTFYLAIFLPVFIILSTIWLLRELKQNWVIFLIFYPFLFILEFFAIKYVRKDIIIDEVGITITSSNHTQKANWSDIIELRECLFGQGELFYEVITKDKKKVGFTSSIKNCGELLKEIENRTGLKFKQRL